MVGVRLAILAHISFTRYRSHGEPGVGHRKEIDDPPRWHSLDNCDRGEGARPGPGDGRGRVADVWHGRHRIVRDRADRDLSGGGLSNVVEARHAADDYEHLKVNHGSSLAVWQPDFSVYSGSEKLLDHLTARHGIESEWPHCNDSNR